MTIFHFFLFFFAISVSCTDGIDCGICEIIVREIENLGEKGPKEVESALEGMCKVLSFIHDFEKKCDAFVEQYGKLIIDLIVKGLDPKKICQGIGLCNKCVLFNKENDAEHSYELVTIILAVLMAVLRKDYVKFKVYPVIDLDFDGFSSVHSQYSIGCEWRGKDCSPLNPKIHPMLSGFTNTPNKDGDSIWGRKKTDEDFNCNGISGSDPDTGESYKEKFCGSYKDNRGLLTIGDSICAGFNILESWLDLDNIFEFLEKGIVSQLSFPEKSLSSGYNPSTKLSTSSLYTYLFSKNRCIHRQYMNLCIGGAMVGDIEYQLSKYKLKKDEVKPSVVYYGLYSNDACRDSFSEMTSLEDFKKSFLKSLDILDSKLPPMSKVVMIGNTDGNILYDTLHDKIHPVSSKTTNFTYSEIWDFLNCAGLAFCGMWLNSNSTMRDQGTKRSEEYNEFMKDVVENHHEVYKNFEIRYIDYAQIALRAMENMEKMGYEKYLYFNKFDGFHISTDLGHPFSGEAIGQLLDEKYPGWLGDVNPYNQQIKDLFGDQGGF